LKANDIGEPGERARIILRMLQGQLTVDDAAALAGGHAVLDVWKTAFVQGGEAALAAIPSEQPTTVEQLLQKLEADFKKDPEAWSSDCPLRRCQFDAYRVIKENLAHYARTGRIDQEAGRFIIQMATGTGKTGVIALCAHFLPQYPRVLIVVPSDELRSQLRTQLLNTHTEPERPSANPEEWSFWKKAGIWPASRPTLRASAGHDLVLPASRHERHITITTPHSVTSYLRSDRSTKRTLAGKYDLLIFDEGHKSAAPKWADSAASVGVPLLLFTATPYRSDGKPLGAKRNLSTILRDRNATITEVPPNSRSGQRWTPMIQRRPPAGPPAGWLALPPPAVEALAYRAD
jgi:Type III restriction enzyme, res subunit